MKKRLLLLCLLGGSFFAKAQPNPSNGTVTFTPGNLVIYRFGDESTDKSGLVPAYIDEITPEGQLVRSIPMPTTASGDNRAFMGGLFGQSREGLMSLSADGRYLTVLGLEGPRNGTAYGDYPKVIGRISGNGDVNTSTAIPTSNIGNVGRSVVTKDGTGFYTTGGGGSVNGRVRYVPFGFNAGVSNANLVSAPLVGGTAAGMSLSIFNNQLYFAEHTSNGSSLAGVIGALGEGLPTPQADMDPVATFSPINLPGLVYPNQFALLDQDDDGVHDFLYVVENSAAGANSVIRKYMYAVLPSQPGAWYDFGSFSHAKLRDAKGIAARKVGDIIQLFINVAPGTGKPSIVRINDPAMGTMNSPAYTITQDYKDINQPGLATTLLYASETYYNTPGTNDGGATVNFRGIAFAPTPFSVTSAAKELDKAKLSVFLPQDNRLHLSLPSATGASEARVLVRDITGRILVSQEVKLGKGVNQLQLPAYPYQNGVYIVNVVSGKEVRSVKFLKQGL